MQEGHRHTRPLGGHISQFMGCDLCLRNHVLPSVVCWDGTYPVIWSAVRRSLATSRIGAFV